MTRASRFSQTDVTSLLKAARAAGEPVERIEIKPDGTVALYFGGEAEPAALNEWDVALFGEDAARDIAKRAKK